MASHHHPLIRVVGSINVDFTTVTPRVPRPGETLLATSRSVNAGGKGANQAVACGRASFLARDTQDVKVEMIGAVGANDPYHATLIAPVLQGAGIGVDGIIEDDQSQTGSATIIVDSTDGENRILVVSGANFDAMHHDRQISDKAFAAPQPDVIVMQGEIPKETVFALVRRGAESPRTSVILNPAPVFEDGIPLDCLQNLDVLVVNETELVQLLTALRNSDSDVAKKALPSPLPENPETLAVNEGFLQGSVSSFRELGVHIIIVTLGAKGVYYCGEGSEGKLVPAVKVERVEDTTAAGDTFVGYFAVSLARWKGARRGDAPGTGTKRLADFPISEAIQKANQAAAKCIQKSGAMQSIPWGYE